MKDIRTASGGGALRIVVLGLALCLAAGCAVGPDYVRPETPHMHAWLEQGQAGVDRDGAGLADWWKRLNDPVLDRLVELAVERNPSLHIAGLRILEARARLGIATGNQFPQLQQLKGNLADTGLSQHNANTSPAIDRYYATASVALDAAWELDFWGRFRRAVESGVWGVDAAEAGYDDVLVTLGAEVARIYVTLRTLEQRLGIAHENVAVQERSLQIARALHEGGDVTELDVTQARALLAGTRASIPRLEAQLRQARNGLSALLGMMPGEADSLLDGPGVIPQAPSDVAVGVPAELLRRRPDIRAAEAQMAAQCAQIGVAKADLYPRFTLFGNIGLSASNAALTYAGQPGASSLGELWGRESVQYSGGMGFGWDIFNYGRIANNVRVQDARFQQLVEQYKNTVLTAARETEDALSAFVRSREEVAFLEQGVAAATRAVEIAMIQYREGLADFQRVLDTQRSKVQAQDQLTATQGSVLVNLIAAYKALGGGWEAWSGRDFLPREMLREMAGRTDWGALLEPPVSGAAGRHWGE